MLFTQEQLKYAYDKGGYILRAWSVYQICHSVNAGYSYMKLYTKPRQGVPLTNRGHWHAGDASFVNKIVSFELVKE